ncbi:DUF4129 domain-containing protein [Halosimplex salinum]|uniref:DUF4129 domain-containing protein n=1 Tax=Halosimplex salinum TaxID=1710538 RepID=UPI000F474BB8|nr:DUF4129 domain-containing protein [Halosimplex salinum]
MDSERLFSVAAAVVLLAGIGASATTLQSTVETTPDDVIDVDSASLPMSSDDVGEYADRLDSDSGSDGTAPDQSGDPSEPSGDSGDGDESESESEDGDESESESEDGDGQQGGSSEPTAGDHTGERRTEGPGDLPGRDTQSLLEWLLSLLGALLAALLRALPVLVALGLLAAAVANRDRIAAALRERFGRGDDLPDEADGPPLRAAPDNEVERAWYEMAALVDGDGVETTSPRECARRAVADGADRAAVERVTETFESVRYGHAAVTPDRRDRALDGLADVRSQLGVGS